MDLSWNPSSWTPSNLAEAAVETLTGSEFAGDIAGGLVGYATFDFGSAMEQIDDGFDNVEAFIGDSRVQQAFDDHFLSGGVDAPSTCTPPSTGYDTPPVTSNPGTDTTAPTPGSGTDPVFLDGKDISNMSIEELVMALLMGAIKEKRGSIRDKAKDLKGMASEHAGMEEGAGKAELGEERSDKLRNLQTDTNQLQQLNQLLTNMMSSFNQMNQSIIQNIR